VKLRDVITVAIVLILGTSIASAQALTPFSADINMASRQGGPATGKMYYSDTKFYIDSTDKKGNHVIMITDLPTQMISILVPDKKTYTPIRTDQMPGGKPAAWRPYKADNPCADEPGITCKKTGAEAVSGRTCDKWLLTGKADRTVWIDQKSQIPLKMVMADSTWELSNIKEGPQDPSLFLVPADYKKK
jgi:hypothetical protein